MTENNEQTNPEITKILTQKIGNGEIFNLYDFARELVRKQKNLTIQEAQWKDHNVSDEAWCIVAETLDIHNNSEIEPNIAFVMKNADKLFNEMEQTVLGLCFKNIVPNQTPEQFREFLSESTICDKALAYLVDDGDSDFFENLSKFHSNQWDDMQRTYVDYLMKCIIYMEHLKDKSFIEPNCIHYMVHEIGNNIDSTEINPNLIELIRKYFNTLNKLNLFDEKQWSAENKDMLEQLGVLQKSYSVVPSTTLSDQEIDQSKATLDDFFKSCQTMPQYIPVKKMQEQFTQMGYEDNSDTPILLAYIKASTQGNWDIADCHNIELKDVFNKHYDLSDRNDVERLLQRTKTTKFIYSHEQSYSININEDLVVDEDEAQEMLSEKVLALETALPDYTVEKRLDGISIQKMSLRQDLNDTNCIVHPVFDNKQIMDVLNSVLSIN